MKTRITIALLSLAVVFLCYARNASWRKNEKPPISLADAQTKALEALKPRNVDYYCIGAVLARTFSNCDWELHFAATNKTEIWVSVGTDGVRVSERGFIY